MGWVPSLDGTSQIPLLGGAGVGFLPGDFYTFLSRGFLKFPT